MVEFRYVISMPSQESSAIFSGYNNVNKVISESVIVVVVFEWL